MAKQVAAAAAATPSSSSEDETEARDKSSERPPANVEAAEAKDGREEEEALDESDADKGSK